MRAAATISSLVIGLVFCGIVLLPPRPCFRRLTDFTHFSLRHENNILRHLAERSRDQTQPAGKLNKLSRCACQGIAGTPNLSSLANCFRNGQTLVAQSRQRAGGAAELHDEQARLDFLETLQVAQQAAPANSATFKPKVTGNACCPCVRPARTVFRCRSASALKWRTTSCEPRLE